MNYIFFVFILFLLPQIALTCSYFPILYGVNTQQPLGYSTNIFIRNSDDCRDACIKETNITCTAFLWPGYPGHCYLFDKVNLSIQIFKDDGPYILYVKSCNDTIPSIGYCEFTVNQTGITYHPSAKAESPGQTTQESCFQFCINQYKGFNYEAFIVNPNGLSNCMLYEDIPQDLPTGNLNLWTKNCHAPPKNCEYTQWSEWGACSATCDGVHIKTREVLQEGDPNGVPCLDSEKSLTENCSVSCDSICTYGNWSMWSECDENCNQFSTRELLTGKVEECDTIDEPLINNKNCTGGACPTPPPPVTTTITVEITETTPITSTLPPTTFSSSKIVQSSSTLAPCIFGNWSDWSECNKDCIQNKERPLISGEEDYCITMNDTLIETRSCTGGLCPPPGTSPHPIIVEDGCRIDNVDSNSRPSKNFKAVGKQENCITRCKSETKFKCGAYITAGPGKSCILFGNVTKPVMQVSNSIYYMQDINCVVGKTPETAICVWEKQENKVDGTTGTTANVAYRYYTMDANHCEQLCNMNHPLFDTEYCGAWVFNPVAGFMKTSPNCYLYKPLTNGDISSFQSGSGDLYIKKCS